MTGDYAAETAVDFVRTLAALGYGKTSCGTFSYLFNFESAQGAVVTFDINFCVQGENWNRKRLSGFSVIRRQTPAIVHVLLCPTL